MAGQPHLITQRQVELRYGSKIVRDYFDGDRGGQADPEKVEEALGEASDVIRGLLLPGFPSLDHQQNLITRDRAVQGYCCAVFMGVAARRKASLLDANGENVHTKLSDKAEKKLKELAAANQRRGGREPEVGNNAKVGVSANREPIPSVFQATAARPGGPGGY
ncbi:MAG: hypothetical protein V3W41_22000 [Planctomycetota bacterium]